MWTQLENPRATIRFQSFGLYKTNSISTNLSTKTEIFEGYISRLFTGYVPGVIWCQLTVQWLYTYVKSEIFRSTHNCRICIFFHISMHDIMRKDIYWTASYWANTWRLNWSACYTWTATKNDSEQNFHQMKTKFFWTKKLKRTILTQSC